MGQDQSSTMNGSQQPHKSCRPCGEWGQKDYSTVKVDATAIDGPGKENVAHVVNGAGPAGGKATAMAEEEQEKMRQRQEREAQEEEIRRAEEKRREMERRVKEEQERQQAEQRRLEAERRRLQLQQEAKEREEEKERKRQEELKLEEQRREEAHRLQAIEDQKTVAAWLRVNGFKGVNDLVRKKLSKVAPLQVAVQQNDVEMLKLLVAAGADPSKVNGKNESALTVAQKLDKKGSHASAVQALTTLAK